MDAGERKPIKTPEKSEKYAQFGEKLVKPTREEQEMSKIMIVDDALFMRKVIRDLLAENGYTDIVEAGDGLKAIEVYKEHHPDLVIMDITMPSLDGIETIKQLHQIDNKVIILMCSAMGHEVMVKEALIHGAKDFVVKPFKSERVISAVQRLLG